MKLVLTITQTINCEAYTYHAEAITDCVLDNDLLAHQFATIGAELQAMADDDRRRMKEFDWNRILAGLN